MKKKNTFTIKVISLISILIICLISCSEKKKSLMDNYGIKFNRIRDTIGLMPFYDKWQITQFSERNAFWCNDSAMIHLISDSSNLTFDSGFYTGKALFFNDDDSLDYELKSEIDIYLLTPKDTINKITRYRLSYLYDFYNNSGWQYFLEYFHYDQEDVMSRYITGSYITKRTADSVLKSWKVYHPTINTNQSYKQSSKKMITD